MQLSSPCTREMPSATERTVPTSARSAPPSSMPSMRCLRMLVISSGLIFSSAMTRDVSLRRSRDLLSKLFQARAHARVHYEVADLQDQPAEHVGVDLGVELDRTTGLLLDLPADLLLDVLVELDRARDRHWQELVLLGPPAIEL